MNVWVEILVYLALAVVLGAGIRLVMNQTAGAAESEDVEVEEELDDETRQLLSRVKPMGGVMRRPRPGNTRRRRQRRVRRSREEVRRARNAVYSQLAGGDARVARALRITGGNLPDSCAGFGRLMKWGKNHHLRPDAPRTFCGKDAEGAQPANWDRGWCVQCDDVAAAVEEKRAVESRRGDVR